MLEGVPFRVNLLNRVVEGNGADGTSLSTSFIIIEGYMYDFIANGDSDIGEYVKTRAGLSLQERFDLFGVAVDFERNEIIYEAYKATRDDAHKKEAIPDDDTGEKKDVSQNSKTPSKAPSKEKI